MILILEGCDGSGKSTLKSLVQKHYDFVEPIPKSLPTHKTTEIMCGENSSALNMAIYNDVDVIMDRGWMSEFIYAKVLRNSPPRFTKTHARMFERMALTAGVTVVLCDPGISNIREGISVRGDEHIRDNGTLTKIYEEYRNFDRLTSLNVLTYDYRKHNPEVVLEQIWDAQQGGHRGKAVFGNGYADTLFVCAPTVVPGAVPYVSWSTDSEAYQLTSALDFFGLQECDIAWTTQTGSALRNLVMCNHYRRVAYIGASIALSVESALDGLPIDVRYIPFGGGRLGAHLQGWEV